MKKNTNYAAAVECFDRGRYHDALAVLNRLLDLAPDARNYALLGATLVKLRMREEAAQAFELAAKQPSRYRVKYITEAIRLHLLNNNDLEALRVARHGLTESLENADLAFLIAGALQRQKMDGVEVFRPLLARSETKDHRHFALRTISMIKRSREEHDLVGEVYRKYPDDKVIRNLFLAFARDINDYDTLDEFEPLIEDEITSGNMEAIRLEVPLFHLRWCSDEKLNFLAGVDWSKATPKPPGITERRHSMPHRWSEKIRIGYLSADFWADHAVMKAFRGVLEAHDKDRFDITLFSNATAENAKSVEDFQDNWGEIISVRDLSDEQAANMIREKEIDILVDLQGHTAETRLPVMNRAAAPVQATWLGYPSTVVNADIDYLICDRMVVPETSAPYFYEKLCRMPETFFPNDAIYRPLPQPFSRRAFGIPENAFVFSSFHTHWKFTRTTMDLWIRILKETEGSYLYLICRPAFNVPENIRKRFVDAGISPHRIIFGNRLQDYTQYISRIGLTDLGLDTYPYNGHTTTSEKLWSGLPMLTHKGTNFASRVSESLLNAVGLPEMVADDPDDYVRRAVYFYNNREELKQIRDRLEANRFTHPLFDAERFCRHLEKAYEMMTDRAKAKLPPDHFDVPALPPRQGPFIVREN